MPKLSYQKTNLILKRGDSDTIENFIHDLQEDLRRLGLCTRRYNGSGINSYNYQVRVMMNILKF
jgi:hypothetical protein